jgi:hypothetical protein
MLIFATEGVMGSHCRKAALACSLVAVLALVPSRAAHAQGTGGPSSSDSRVGYIDDAIPGNVLRQRFDAAYDSNRATRAEFFYARSGPQGPGLPRPEPNVDYQELSTYLETAFSPRFSAFVEVPERFLNPDVNRNAAGLGDLNAGFKYALLYDEDLVTTFQFRTYAPTGDAARGLGTHHVSLEPALLFYKRLDDRSALEGELRYWVPIDGTELAGNIIRYGLGWHYDLAHTRNLVFTPVTEVVGWTVLNGKQNVAFPSGLAEVRDASGDTIVNAKLGVRVKLGSWGDVYTGYGRALTGDRWYENIYRLELRLFY